MRGPSATPSLRRRRLLLLLLLCAAAPRVLSKVLLVQSSSSSTTMDWTAFQTVLSKAGVVTFDQKITQTYNASLFAPYDTVFANINAGASRDAT